MLPASRTHILVSAAMLAIFVATCAAIDVAARNERLAYWFDEHGDDHARKTNVYFVHQGAFGDALHGLMLVDAPQMKFEQGGVYFFGSSNLVLGAQFNHLPGNESKFIHNFGFPAVNPTQCLQFIRYFEQSDGFLKREPAKTCVVIALAEDDLLGFPAGGWFVPSALSDMDVFGYDPREGISTIPMPQWRHAYLIRKLRWYDLTLQVPRMFSHLPLTHLNRPAFEAEVKRILAANPPGGTEQELKALQTILDYVQSRNAHVAVVRMPAGSWSLGTPLDDAFNKNVPAMCAARGVPLLDLSRLLSDEEFMDAHHPTFLACQKERDELAKFALTQLRAMGVQVDEH